MTQATIPSPGDTTPTPRSHAPRSTATGPGRARSGRRVAPVTAPATSRSLHQLFKDEEEIYVSFEGIEGRPIGNFVLGHPNKEVRIPPLPLGREPINLTHYASLDQLRDCTDLRRAIATGRLKLWDPEEARSFIAAHPDATQAHEEKILQLQETAREIDEGLKARLVAGNADATVNRRVQNLCLQVKENKLDPPKALRQFMLMDDQGTLKESDFEYIRSRGANVEICLWAGEVLAEIHDLEVEARNQGLEPEPHEAPRVTGTHGGQVRDDTFAARLDAGIQEKRRGMAG